MSFDFGIAVGSRGKINADGTEIGSLGRISTSSVWGQIIVKIIRLYSSFMKKISFNVG